MRKLLLRLKQQFITLINGELSIRKVALCISLGLVLGIVPFFMGLNIYLSLLFAWRLKLNHVLIQFVSNVVYPIQILLFVPFIRIGTYLFSAEDIEFSGSFILSVFKESIIDGLTVFGMWNLYGVVVWLIIAIPLTITLYYLLYNLIIWYKVRSDNVLVN